MKDNDNIIDFGSITVPTRWEDVTLKMYQDIERLYDGKDESFDVRKVIHIMCGLSEDEVNSMPVDFLERIMAHLTFLQTKPEDKEPSNSIVIDGEKYTVHTENKLRTGEYIASDTAMKCDKHNYAAILAILCRKEGEVYDSHFENEILEDRIKLWEKQPVVNILPLICFFMECYIVLQMPTLLSSKVEEALDLTRKDIETLQRNGEISKRCMKSQMKKLKKLEKYINSI